MATQTPRAGDAPRALGGRRLLTVALLLVLGYHGVLLATGSYARTYDAFVHIFFADHYARDWFATWEPRWYTGFPVTSYPPGVHQLVAVASRLVGLEAGFVIVQLGALCLLVTGVFRFARIWVEDEAAGWAAVLAAASTAIAETVHVFGQLPTTIALGFLLHSLPHAHRWFLTGSRRALLSGVSLAAAATACHHVTTLFGSVFFLGPVVALSLLERLRTPLPGEPSRYVGPVTPATLVAAALRRARRGRGAAVRVAVYGVAVVGVLVVVVLPYWLWSRSDPITQVSIPHGSRANFLADPNAGLFFFLIPWGPVLLALPTALVTGLRSRAWPLAASVALLFVLGTGGTTPVPRMLLRAAFDILTLDRFTFWGAMAVLPLVGTGIVSLRRGPLHARLSRISARAPHAVALGAAVTIVTASVLTACLPVLRPMQPPRIDVGPIVSFLAKDDHARWRYLTLGFGDQMAWLSARTTAQSIDGNYHSARRVPELTSTPVERLEGSKFQGIPGLGSLQQILAVPGKYHLKFVFAADRFYDPLLAASGWHALGRLENGVAVWERADVAPLPSVVPSRTIPRAQQLAWGILPMGAILLAALVLFLGRLVPPPPLVSRALPPSRSWKEVAPRRRPRSRAAGLSRLVPSGRREQRILRWAAVLAGIGALAGVVGTRTAPADDPTAPVRSYFEALSVRRVDAAYAALDPRVRPSRARFLLQRSVDGGLISSYATLDSVRARVLARRGDRATVDVRLRYMTAIKYVTVRSIEQVRRRDARWYLVPRTPPSATPPQTFSRRPAVDLVQQGRRRLTDARTVAADILDRPELRVVSARLVERDGRLSAIGEVVNEDVDPGDVTIEASLTGRGRSVLASYQAQIATMHVLRPRQVTPFRVDFEGVAGTLRTGDPAAGDFRPGLFTPLTPLTEPVRGVDISARAVVADYGTDPMLAVEDLVVDPLPAGRVRLRGTLRNIGAVEATVPHVLVTLRDADGAVAWVDDLFLDRAIRPARTEPFSLVVTPRSEVRTVVRRGRRFDDHRPRGLTTAIDAGVRLPRASGYASASVQADAFARGSAE